MIANPTQLLLLEAFPFNNLKKKSSEIEELQFENIFQNVDKELFDSTITGFQSRAKPSSSLNSVYDLLTNFVKYDIGFIDLNGIISYLARNSQIIHYLLAACLEIFKSLKRGTKIFLDFDDGLKPGYILIIVRQEEYQEDLLDILFEIGYKYIDITQNMTGTFRIITDFKST